MASTDGIVPLSAPGPAEHSPDMGEFRERVLRSLLFGDTVGIPQDLIASLVDWAENILQQAEGPALGLIPQGIAADMAETLRWAGMPFGLNGPLRWGGDIIEADTKRPEIIDDQLQLPSANRLAEMTSLGIKPMRYFIGQRLGLRLQSATNIRLFIWSNQALVISCTMIPIGGFLHGPQDSQRFNLAMNPGGHQLFHWDR